MLWEVNVPNLCHNPPGAPVQGSWSCIRSACLGRPRLEALSTCLRSGGGQQPEVPAEVREKWMGHFFCKWRAPAWSSLSRAQHVGPGCSFYELMEMGPERTSLIRVLSQPLLSLPPSACIGHRIWIGGYPGYQHGQEDAGFMAAEETKGCRVSLLPFH